MKGKIIAAIPVLILLISLTPLISVGIQMGAEISIGSYDTDQKDHDMASTGTADLENVYVVYEDESRGPTKADIRFKGSSDGGLTFTSTYDFMIDPDSDDRQIDPAIDAFDNGTMDILAVVYIDNSFGSNSLEYHIVVRISNNSGSNWSEPILVTNDSIPGYPNNRMVNTDICFDPEGNIYIVWQEGSHIRISVSEDLGSSWSSPIVVSIHENPENKSYTQSLPTISVTDDDVVVAFQSDPEYKQFVYSTSSDNNPGSLDFSYPVLIPEFIYPMYRTYLPRLDSSNGTFHMVFWDFSTDINGINNENHEKDRPSVTYTRSTDGGSSWSVGSQRSIHVNTSSIDYWVSAPDISSFSSNDAVVTFLDDSSGSTEVQSCYTKDGGRTWSKKMRANEYLDGAIRAFPRVVAADPDDLVVSWIQRDDADERSNIVLSRSEIDTPPSAITGVKILAVNETSASISWNINRESDFSHYEIYLNRTANFTVSGNSLKNSTREQGTGLIDLEYLNPDTTYHTKIAVVDHGGARTVSEDVSFTTHPVNQAPAFMITPPSLYVDEDGENRGAMNLSKWIEEGWVKDDHYNDRSELKFEVIFESDDPIINAVFRERDILQPFWILDISTIKPDAFGEESVRINVTDPGKDGGFGSPDDLWSLSEPFTIFINGTNDLPGWSSFQDLKTGMKILLDEDVTEITLPLDTTGCVEGMEYIFSLTGSDIDGDFLTFSTSDDRIDIRIDPDDPRIRSIFTIVPENSDVPFLPIEVKITDGNGGIRSMLLRIPVVDVNVPPVFTGVNGNIFKEPVEIIEFEMNEDDLISFNISARDDDPGDRIILSSNSERVTIKEIDETTWTVSFRSLEGDSFSGSISFDLDLYDRLNEHTRMVVKILILDNQKPVEWIKGKYPIEIEYTYDIIDPNEEKDVNKFGGKWIRAEWNEEVLVRGNAFDPDMDDIQYSFVITDMNGTIIASYSSRTFMHAFSPSLGNLDSDEKFRITMNATDGNFLGIEWSLELWVHPDIDNDNDGMIDHLEIHYFGSLDDALPEDDPDDDNIPNLYEIGVAMIPIHTDPTVPNDIIGDDDDPDDSSPSSDRSFLPGWVLISGGAGLVIIVIMLVGSALIVISSKKKERDEEEEIENRVRSMEKRSEEFKGLYGKMGGEEYFGVDQSTLTDLKLDLGGQIYHDGSLKEGGHLRRGEIKEDRSGPNRESTCGPLFDEGSVIR